MVTSFLAHTGTKTVSEDELSANDFRVFAVADKIDPYDSNTQ